VEPVLKVVLLESPLEIVPPQLWGHPDVVRSSRRYGVEPGEMLLDKSLHYHAMESLPQKWKRGRPDIVHTTLLVLQDSLLNQAGRLRVYIHVLDGRVFAVRPETRIPKHYERFRGLMAQLLRVGQVPPPPAEPLIGLEAPSLRDFVRRHGRLILLDERGAPSTSRQAARLALQMGRPLGIGMFPRGEFRKQTLRKAVLRLSLAQGRPFKAWSIAARLVSAAEDLLGLEW
jgi:rRNA small subunit pseudouridine methyltransferase Nep1